MTVRVEQHAEPIPGYRLIERLGGGGFGEVWKCEAPGGMHKAIKFVFGDLSSAGDSDQRAKQELKALERVRSVRHPYILSLERYEVIDGQLLIVMELADRNLWDRYKECRAQGLPGVPRDELLGYMEETAEALDLMNQEYQLQHLDIKPQNLFLVYNHIKVADFGLVKDLEGSHASVTGGITPVYAAPETFDGKVSRYSDQYSLAIVFQELLTGQRPFNGTNVRQLIMQHISAEPNASALPEGDRPAILRALSKRPDGRFPSCRELVARLRAASDGQARPEAVAPSSLTSAATVISSNLPGAATPAPPDQLGETADPSQGNTLPLRVLDQASVSQQATAFRAPPEVHQAGCLFPALVLGCGQVGMQVLHKAREVLEENFAPLVQLPHLRWLLLDTDPDVMRQATKGPPGAALSGGEVLLAQLNRPSYYLKPRGGSGSTGFDSWLNPRMLYRIPRSQVTAGVRALGRLAFVDNYRGIARRLQQELEAALDPASLQQVARASGLGVRTNRPRVYVIASLGGGTGSGMFLDLAYTLRAMLRQAGYDNPDVVGVLLLPPVDGSRTRVMTLGNTYAALRELNYFGAPGRRFQALYHEREAAVQEQGPPFGRVILLPLPEESDDVGVQELLEVCGQFLYRDLVTPLGKEADLARAGLPGVPWEKRGQYFQTFNLYQLSWPRQQLLQRVSRQLCQRLVARWVSKDPKPVRELAQQHVQEAWVRDELGADSFIHRVQAEVVKALGRPPDAAFAAILEPISRASAQQNDAARGRAPRGLDPRQLAMALGQLEELVGRPQDDVPTENPPELVRAVREAAGRLAAEWGQKLVEVSVRLIEEPSFRLAGAEEAIRHLVATLDQVLQHHEPLARDLSEKAAAAYEQLRLLAGGPLGQGQARPRLGAAEALEMLRHYPKWRYQGLVLQSLAGAFVGLRGNLSDELREVNFCRVRLGELARLLEEGAGEPGTAGRWRAEGSIGRKLFPLGCKDLAEAVEQFLGGVKPEHLYELDLRVEDMLRKRFTALVYVCLTSANVLKDVEAAMLEVAREFVAEHLPPVSVADLFFSQFQSPEEAEAEVNHCFAESKPELAAGWSAARGEGAAELCVLAAPEDQSGENFRALVKETLPRAEVHAAGSPDDIVFYRERLNARLEDLEHMGPVARDAYAQMNAAENFTPHSRCDLDFRAG